MIALLGRVGAWVRGLEGWRRLLFAWAMGLVSALGFAPFNLFPLLLLGFAALVLLIDGARERARPVRMAVLTGLAFGFGQFLAGMHWIIFPFLVDPDAHAWQIPFVIVLFPGGLALFIAAAAAAACALWRPGPARIFIFTICYALAEWLRGHVLTGFPWNIEAYGWGASLGVLQSMALFGAYGLSLLTILFGASLAELFRVRSNWRFPAIMAALFVVLWLGGEARLALIPTRDVPGVRMRLVQPNIPQAEKIQLQFAHRDWERLMSLSATPAKQAPSIIVWPEAATDPYLRYDEFVALDDIARLTDSGAILMTGAIRRGRDREGAPRYYNSFYVFGRGAAVLDIYDKFHLVPFGEYLPFEKTLGALGLTKLTGITSPFAAGDGPHTVNVPGAPAAGPLICYEIDFPGAVVGKVRPGWLVNVSDDSWFGPWAGPLQHLLVARARAIEEGIAMVRAANTGITAIIDPLGRITARLDFDQTGVLDGPLPAAIAQTPYSRIHGLWFWLMMGACTGLSWVFSKGK